MSAPSIELSEKQAATVVSAASVAFIGAIVLGQFMAERDAKAQAAVEQARHRVACSQAGARAFIELTPAGERWICAGAVTARAEVR